MRKRKLKIITFFFVALFFFSLVFSFALAQDRKLEIEYPEIFGLKPETVKTFLPEYAKYIFNFSIAIFGLVVFGVLVWGGFLYLTSAGNPAKMQDAKEQISSAFLGLVILLLSYIILTTINPQLVMFRIPFLPQIVISRCTADADCDDAAKYPKCQPPGTCECRFGACVKKVKPPALTLIAVEIPLGQMIENGVWGKKRTNRVNTLLSDFENFLNEEITVDSEKFNRISDLNRYLKRLTEDCRCENSKSVCGKPEYGGAEQACSGDPCDEDTRDKIKNAFNLISERVKKLNDFRKRFSDEMKSLDEDAAKLVALQKSVESCISEKGEIFNLPQFLAAADFYEARGIKIEIQQKFVTSQGDPLTFYCTKGGTMLDFPLDFGAGEAALEAAEEAGRESDIEEMSCPAEIPVGEVLEEAKSLAFTSSAMLEDLISAIDALVESVRNLSGSVSQCSEKNCTAKCGDMPNPCLGTCYCPPGDPCIRCNPRSIPPCLVCGLWNCRSPDNQVTGACSGAACPSDKIDEALEIIKADEDEIFAILDSVKTNLSDVSFALKDEENPINLEVLRGATSVCFSEDVEEPTWAMLYCEDALGYPGLGGETIADCHPLNFFCCTSSREALAKIPFPTSVQKPRPPTYITAHVPLPSGPCNDKIIAQAMAYRGIPYCQIPPKKCPEGVRAGHCYNPIPFGPAGVEAVDCSGFVSRVYRDLGIFPPRTCISTAVIPRIAKKGALLQEIPADKIQKGDLVLSGKPVCGKESGHVVIYADDNPSNVNKKFYACQSPRPGKTVYCGWQSAKVGCQKYYRRKVDCR